MDFWSQILATIEEPGSQVQWLHVPSHIGVVGNDKADLLADMGRRKSPLLRGYVTTSQALMDQRNQNQIWIQKSSTLPSGRQRRR